MKKVMKLAVYDSGFGLSVGPCSGEAETSTLAMVHNRFFKLYLPDITLPSEVWDAEFDKQKKLVIEMVEAWNNAKQIKLLTKEKDDET